MSDNDYKYVSQGLEDTDRFGAALAQAVSPGTTIALRGTLGAGKTRLVQSIAAACGIARQDVVSPTFVLMQQYEGTKTLVHIDAYRIADDDEFLQLGVEEYFDSDAIVLIEWAGRVVDCLPLGFLQVTIDVTGETQREFTVTWRGDGASAAVANISDLLSM